MADTDRVLAGRAGAHKQWSRISDRSAHTAPARKRFLDKFEREVDPEGELDPGERARRAESALKAHMAELARKSAKARKKSA